MFSLLYNSLKIQNIFRMISKPQLFLKRIGPQTKYDGNKLFSILEQSDLMNDPISNHVDWEITKDTIAKVNKHISQEQGRLFAVVHLCGKQFKVTSEDIILVEGYWPPKNGDEIKLEKVLLVGARDYTLVGRPILPIDLVYIKATVIEKDLSHTKTVFFKKRRKQYMRINFYRSQMTMLRINEIIVEGKINEHKKITQYERV